MEAGGGAVKEEVEFGVEKRRPFVIKRRVVDALQFETEDERVASEEAGGKSVFAPAR